MRYFKIVTLSIFMLFLLIITGGILVGYLYENDVKAYLVGEINKQLNTPVIVNAEDIQFSVLKRFPYASLEFNNVKALEAVSKIPKNTLFDVSSVSLQFNIIDIFRKKYRIKKVELKEGELNIRYDFAGKDNYHFWKSAAADTINDNFSVSIEKVVFDDFQINYSNNKLKLYSFVTIQDGFLRGDFSSDQYTLESKAQLFFSYFKYDHVNYLDQKNVELKLNLNVDHDNYKIENSKVKIADLNFNVAGAIGIHEQYNLLNLIIKGEDMRIGSVISILPENYSKDIKEYKSDGMFYFESSIKGKADQKNNPVIKAKFGIENAKIVYSKNDMVLNEVNLKGSLLKNNLKEELTVDTFSAQLKEGSANGSFRITNFSDPYLSTSFSADIDLSEAKKMFPLDTLESLNGRAKLNVKYNGKAERFKKYSHQEFKQIRASGEMLISDLNFRLKNNPLQFDNFNGSFVFDNSEIIIQELNGNISESDFALQGILNNVFAYYFSENEELTVNATLKSNNINLNEILQDKEVESVVDTAYILQFSPFINLNLSSEVQHISFRNFEASNIKGNLKLNEERLSGDMISFSTMDGQILINHGLIDASRSNQILITCDASLRKININKMFTQLENFGQDIIIDKNIKGIATADIQFASVWSKDLKINLDQIYVKSNISIEKGELIKFKYLKSLSKFIKLSELEHVKFSTLQNQIEIRNKKINIPKMEINSSALNIIASGTHTFDNEIDYKIKLLLNELLSKKARNSKIENEEFGEVEDDGLGKTALYLSMTGSVYNPVIKYDRRSAMKTFKEDFKTERQNLKKLLQDEFGWFKKDSTNVSKKKDEKQKDDRFIIRWDENEKEEKGKRKKAEENDEDF